jgi:hypothetical protein
MSVSNCEICNYDVINNVRGGNANLKKLYKKLKSS